MHGTDMEFHNKYPMVYFTAKMYGFSSKDIEQMIDEVMFDEYCRKYIKDKEMCEISLKALFYRLDVNKDEFMAKVKELANKKTEEELKELVGWQQVNLVYALAGLS
ncbi:hypothetical protein [Paenibacillus aceti]|uniref:AAA-ATPase-like domain-containing protein n=1 Tax=Paenibacillus aceti TaxID=1820010 RepID=A0ABQ1VQG2_9BACL|nr:hypothetical protein [Paenibacillus aceti]GGF86599.1 hypothetical protein GCM10010913_05160 [Paenibacillus aceti]